MSEPRRPVGIASGNFGVLVVCEDGTVFTLPSSEAARVLELEPGSWIETNPIPGTARDIERQKESHEN